MGIIVFTYIFWVEVMTTILIYIRFQEGMQSSSKLCVVYVFMGFQFTWYMYVAK